MATLRSSLFVSLAQNYGAMIIQFATSILIARLLTPGELGIFSVAVVLGGLAQTVRDFGVASYITQEKDLTEDRLRSALGVAILGSWVLAAAMALLSAPVAEFYREPGVRSIMLVLAINLALMPFGAVTMAHLSRAMNFVPRAIAGLASAAVHCTVAITLAVAGFSYMSMAWASLAGVIVTIIVAQVYRPSNLPYLPNFKEARRIVGFGAMSTTALVANEVGKGSPDLIIGRVIGMEPVALFGRASGLIDLFDRVIMNTVWMIAMPYFSMQARQGGDLKESFLKSVTYLTALSWSFYVVLGIIAYPIIRILFGSQWDESVPLLRYLCVGAFLMAPFQLLGSILIGIGRIKDATLAIVGMTAIQIIGLFIAAQWGVEVVAIAFVVLALVRAILFYIILQRVLRFSFIELMHAMRRSFGVALLVGVPPLLTVTLLPPDPQQLWAPLLWGGVGASGVWIASLFLFGHPLQNELVSMFQGVKRRLSI